MTDGIELRRTIAATLGGALIGRVLADLIGAPAWVGGILGGAAPLAVELGAVERLPPPVALAVQIAAAPGVGFGRAMYPQGLGFRLAPPSGGDEGG